MTAATRIDAAHAADLVEHPTGTDGGRSRGEAEEPRGALGLGRALPRLEGPHPAAQGEDLLDGHVLGVPDPALDLAQPAPAAALLVKGLGGAAEGPAEQDGGDRRPRAPSAAPDLSTTSLPTVRGWCRARRGGRQDRSESDRGVWRVRPPLFGPAALGPTLAEADEIELARCAHDLIRLAGPRLSASLRARLVAWAGLALDGVGRVELTARGEAALAAARLA